MKGKHVSEEWPVSTTVAKLFSNIPSSNRYELKYECDLHHPAFAGLLNSFRK
jgi:hypothetical protein